MIERTFEVAFANAVVNHPEVHAQVRGPVRGKLDLTPIIRDPRNITLIGEYGISIFAFRMPGVYEWHAAVLPDGHGPWALSAARAALAWLFEHTDAVAVLAPVPADNKPARHVVSALGFQQKQVLPASWTDAVGRIMPLHVYTLLRRDWGRQH